MIKLKPFIVFATVWHERGQPYNVSSYHYCVAAVSEAAVKRMMIAEVKGYRHWKHSLTIEEIVLDKPHIRSMSSYKMESLIMKKAIQQTLKLNERKHAALKARCEKQKRGVCSREIDELLEFPNQIYELFAASLQPGSTVVIDDGHLYLYESRKKNEYTFREEEIEQERVRVLYEVKALAKEVQKKLEEFVRGL